MPDEPAVIGIELAAERLDISPARARDHARNGVWPWVTVDEGGILVGRFGPRGRYRISTARLRAITGEQAAS